MSASNWDSWKLLAMRIRQVREVIEEEAKRVVAEDAEGLCADIKSAMPVDTGRAKAGWGKYTPEDLTRNEPKNASSEGDAIWIVSPKEWSIRQGTNVWYTRVLNEGSSQQAPAGFIDAKFAIWREKMLEHVRNMRTFDRVFKEK
jgi:hypothetical protein